MKTQHLYLRNLFTTDLAGWLGHIFLNLELVTAIGLTTIIRLVYEI